MFCGKGGMNDKLLISEELLRKILNKLTELKTQGNPPKLNTQEDWVLMLRQLGWDNAIRQ
jgi:hypothetical protein